MNIEQTKNVRLRINRLGQQCSVRGADITTRQLELAELNQQYPGERRKPYDKRDPDYVLRRSQITETLDLLTVEQRYGRTKIRELI